MRCIQCGEPTIAISIQDKDPICFECIKEREEHEAYVRGEE